MMMPSEQVQSLRRQLRKSRAMTRALRKRMREMVELRCRSDALIVEMADCLHRRKK